MGDFAEFNLSFNHIDSRRYETTEQSSIKPIIYNGSEHPIIYWIIYRDIFGKISRIPRYTYDCNSHDRCIC